MLTIAPLLERRREVPSLVRLLGAGPLAGLMAAARIQLGRDRALAGAPVESAPQQRRL